MVELFFAGRLRVAILLGYGVLSQAIGGLFDDRPSVSPLIGPSLSPSFSPSYSPSLTPTWYSDRPLVPIIPPPPSPSFPSLSPTFNPSYSDPFSPRPSPFPSFSTEMKKMELDRLVHERDQLKATIQRDSISQNGLNLGGSLTGVSNNAGLMLGALDSIKRGNERELDRKIDRIKDLEGEIIQSCQADRREACYRR
eukprot:TRINITY_DN40482_c0_g1_i1.p1 TRINITY_DN40482_c0_g1~~TRINITY_DN40482_c0_g1_i1.p1  ORF type:complete len:196 (-),score=12.55 TRINITY_DN40482_c0_g1_i1:64-651(-)